MITVDRNKLGCNLDKKGSRFLITYGEVKGVTEHYTSEKGSRGTYLETTVSSKNGNRILMAEDFMIKVSEIRYHLQDRYRKLNWDFQSLIDVYKQISEDYAAMIPLGRVTEGRTRFTEMFSNRNSSRSPYHLFENYNNDFNIKRLEYIELTDRYSSPLNLSNAEIVPNPSKEFRKKYSVYTEGGKFPNEIVDPFSKSDSKFVNDLLKKSFGKHSRRILTYFGTSQNGKSTSIKCGFSGRLNDVKDDYLTVVYISESIMNSKNSVSYGKEHLKGNKHNNRWGQLGAKSMVAGKFADPEIAIKNDIIKHYKGLYNQNTRKATNFRRARRTNWKKAISVLLKKGLVGEARRYQKHANIILSAFHDHITSFNTKIQAFRPIEDVD